MRGKSLYLRFLLAMMLAAALIIGGCGSDGKDGKPGEDGITTIIEVPATEQPAMAQAESCYLCHSEGRISDPATKHVWADPGDEAVAIIYPTTVSNAACMACHGNVIFSDALGRVNGDEGITSNAVGADGTPRPLDRSHHMDRIGVSTCINCHSDDGFVAGALGDRLMTYVHGIHISGGLDGNYASSAAVKNNWNFSVRYPSEMHNCVGCHDSDNLATVLAEPVTYNNCISCHGGIIRSIDWTQDADAANIALQTTQKDQAWRGLSNDDAFFGGVNHSNFDPTTECIACHNGNIVDGKLEAGKIAGKSVGDYHSGYSNRGYAQYVAETSFNVTVEGVERVGLTDQYEITWMAVDPSAANEPWDVCSPTIDDGVTVTFTPIVRLAYFEPGGDDITNAGVGNIGQPANTKTLANDCTTVAGKVVSTFTIDAVDMSIDRALAILKPQVTISGLDHPNAAMQGGGRPRIPAVSYAFDLDNGAEVARRMIVESQKCLDCHGALLYNHGPTGGRFDNVDSCIACHNSGATDQGVRASLRYDGETITAANSYDGKDAETFSFAYNMHAIHSAGATDSLYMVYRGRGLYGYGGNNTQPQNWPLDADGNARAYLSNSATYNLVTITNAAGVTTKVPSYLKKVNYPRPLLDCTACHADSWVQDAADQAKAVAVSITSGADLANQNDDKLMGPATATCVSCHSNGATRSHAFQNSWIPTVIDGGKGAVLDAAK